MKIIVALLLVIVAVMFWRIEKLEKAAGYADWKAGIGQREFESDKAWTDQYNMRNGGGR
jgi:hypothetical protein